VIADNYEHGEAWLVYCDDSDQLAQVRDALLARGINTLEFHTNSEGATDVDLYEFESSGGVMLSINCLDEGVDIPRISHALVLASSSTRREFIQRRGRVLRQHSSKTRAVIHDALVETGGFDDPESVSFLKKELARAWEFVESASDSESTRVQIQNLAAENGIILSMELDGEGSDDEGDE
jgi:superfamily II DNA or RNA helicase